MPANTAITPHLLITGAASGLGRALAVAWSKKGAAIAVADIHTARAEETVSLCLKAGAKEAFFIALNVQHAEDFEKARHTLLSRWGVVDIVINNAGVAGGGAIDSIQEKEWQWMLDINLMGAVRGVAAFTPLFKQQNHGQFINIASMAGLLNPPGMANYNVAKAGVIALSETLSSELSPWNIRTLAVCPSFFQTHLAESLRTDDNAMRASFTKLLTRSELSADDIAEGIIQAVAQGERLYLPHQRAAEAWQNKQEDPQKFFEENCRLSEKQAGFTSKKQA